MIIKTINPITINQKRISKPSMYLNADGLEVKTVNPLIVNGVKESMPSKYLSFDGSGKPVTSAEIKQFQTWLDGKYPTWLNGGKLNGGAGYGTFGPSTTSAWKTYGAEFTASLNSGMPMPTPSATTEPTKEEQIAQAKKGKVWDKAKGFVTSDKAKDVLKSLTEGGGIMGAINALLGGGTTATTSTDTTTQTASTTTPPTGLSMGAKIGIAVGSVAVLGIIIYAVTRPKTSK